MKLAYIISAYQLPTQLVRLVQRLDSPNAFFLLHVDRKTPATEFETMCDGLAKLPNCVFLPRHTCRWADFGHVRATLKGIAELLARGVDFDYAVLLTGQDYPIKSVPEIERFFEGQADREFIQHYTMPRKDWKQGGMDRIERWHFYVGRRKLCFPGKERFSSAALNWLWAHASRRWQRKRKFPRGLQPFAGSSYWCLTRPAIEYIHTFIRRSSGYQRFFHRVHAPDEIFFHTILGNSPLGGNIVNNNLRYMDWMKARSPGLRPPAILGIEDLGELRQSEALFARKFDIRYDDDVLKQIDEELLGQRLPGANASA